MQKRVRKIANFFAFNLLFFALYLNFIDRDSSSQEQNKTQQTAAFGALNLGTKIQKPVLNPIAVVK